MMKNEIIKDIKNEDIIKDFYGDYERAIILIPELDTPINPEEIISLAKTAGAYCEKIFVQKIKIINPATFFGSGKLEEVNEYCQQNEIDLAIFDGELSPSQTINISDCLDGLKVIDRTTLILDIFAKNALSGEGKVQVELAQLKYIYPRLKGKGSSLSRLGGGIGTRGPGETKLETDRRHIRTRILYLEKQIEKMKETKNLQKMRRNKNKIKTVALVGYTNTGKSTLMNALTDAGVLCENKLFATLETKVSKLRLENIEVLLIDTVGFIRNLPTKIVEAFKSTLDTAVEADLILNVCDASGDYENQLKTTNSILKELDCKSEIITVYNKCDKLQDNFFDENSVMISAKNKTGLENLKKIIEKKLSQDYISLSFKVDFAQYGEIIKLKKHCENYQEEFNDSYVKVNIVIKQSNLSKFNKFI